MINYLAQASINTELLYSFVIIFVSLMIYFGTKDLYELTNHKGIKYFRLSFLFFAVSIFIRSILKFLFLFIDPRTIREIVFNLNVINPIILFLFMYFSAMAIFSLLYSVMCKKWNGKCNLILILNIVAVIIALISVVSGSSTIIFGIYLFLLLFVAFITFMAYKESKNKKKKINLYTVYILLSAFWILNIIDILVPNVLQAFQLIIYFVSISIFLSILYKVLRKLGSN